MCGPARLAMSHLTQVTHEDLGLGFTTRPPDPKEISQEGESLRQVTTSLSPIIEGAERRDDTLSGRVSEDVNKEMQGLDEKAQLSGFVGGFPPHDCGRKCGVLDLLWCGEQGVSAENQGDIKGVPTDSDNFTGAKNQRGGG